MLFFDWKIYSKGNSSKVKIPAFRPNFTGSAFMHDYTVLWNYIHRVAHIFTKFILVIFCHRSGIPEGIFGIESQF
jgi:hypothetical protein